MKIAVASDLHLEFADLDIENEQNADVLILSGDILVACDITQQDPHNILGMEYRSNRYHDFMQRCSGKFPHVIFIMGNHEHYNGDFAKTEAHLKDVFGYLKNVYVLEKEVRVIDGVTFIGGTLWTDCNKGDPLTLHALSDMMNDYRVIRNDEHGYTKLRPAHTMHRHQQTLSYLKQVLVDMKDKKVVFVGHHAPSAMSTHDRYKHNVHYVNFVIISSTNSSVVFDFLSLSIIDIFCVPSYLWWIGIFLC